MKTDVPAFIQEIAKTSQDMWQKGWAEANGGNISLRLKPDKMRGSPALKPKSDWAPLAASLPTLGGERFLVTGTGRYLRNIAVFPEKNIGVIELDRKGARWRMLWGFEPAGRPTSELEAHLRTHAVIKETSGDKLHAVIHTHATHLIALTYALKLTSETLTKLLWQSHAECIVGFPAGVEFIPWMMAGSSEIAAATAEALKRRTLAVWQHHGVFGVGRNLDAAFGIIDMAEKAAQIHLLARAAGGFACRLSTDQLRAIARNFGVTADKAALAANTATLFPGACTGATEDVHRLKGALRQAGRRPVSLEDMKAVIRRRGGTQP